MIEHNVQVFDGDDGFFDFLDGDVDFLGDLLPGFLDVLDLVDVQLGGVWAQLLPDVVVHLDVEAVPEEGEGVVEDVVVAGGGAVDQPGDTLQADTRVDDLYGELVVLAVGVVLVLHEHHIPELQTMHEILNTGSEISSSSPDILNECNLLWINLELLSQPPIVKLHTLLLEEHILIRVVKHLNAEHHEPRVVSAGEADVVEVVESHAELWADQGVGWGVQLARYAVWLEAENTGCHVINVVSPAGDHWIPLD